MSSREEKKRQTRKSLMDAALMLVGSGNNFSSISLREVAKNAGVVPTSFYRHFSDMEELGLNLVDDLGLILRRIMRATRQHEVIKNGGPAEDFIRGSVEVYVDFVCANRSHFYFMCQCRTGGTSVLRTALRNELKYFSSELASDISHMSMLPDVDSQDLEMIAQLIVATMSEITIDILDKGKVSSAVQKELTEKTVRKLRLIWLGARRWKSS